MRCVKFFLLLIPTIIICQSTKKEVYANRIFENVKIDGQLNESFWLDADVAKNFIMMTPENGKYERVTQKTEVRFIYDDHALYIGASLFDSNPYEILRELGPRDAQNKNTDAFGIFINPFNDGINEFCFIVTAAGVQIDKKISLTTDGYKEEINWDSVWESATKINKHGWFVEIKIPYSAIRFPNKSNQEWGLNIWRKIRKLREEYSWNYIDIKKKHIGNQAGVLKGISNINSPIRLSLLPYLSSQLNKFQKEYSLSYGGGIDLKYGINESFTLDMTLVPDFQQVEFDPLVLNTTPYEIKFNENRSFFTEGIELFQKGNLFYSRRVGGVTSNEISLSENEILLTDLGNTRLINAMKISGRTDNDYGIGVFNGITAKTYVDIIDTIQESNRTELIEPTTNYNMLVLDKSFNQNSFLTFVNTNVSRKRGFRNANVSALIAAITNKNNTHSLNFNIKRSSIHENNNSISGFSSLLNIQKINNNIQYGVKNYIESDTYDINDLGFMEQNNEINNECFISYNIFTPQNNILKGKNELRLEHKMLYKPNIYNELIIKYTSEFVTTKHLYVRFNARYFFEEHDYFESRTDNQNFVRPPALKFGWMTSSDYRKAFALNTMFSYKYRFSQDYIHWDQNKNTLKYLRINPRVRVNNNLFFQYIFAYEKEQNQFGWITQTQDNNILFSRRDQKTYTNKLILDYTFSTKSYLELVLRHYWSTILNSSYYFLQSNGQLENINTNNLTPTDLYNVNFNTWNMDLKYSWEFKAGSLISLVWQNQLTTNVQSDLIETVFARNIDELFENPTSNIFSIKFTYYIDAQNILNK